MDKLEKVKIHAVICSRKDKPGAYLTDLVEALEGMPNTDIHILYDQPSIFSAYSNAHKELASSPEDIFIFCHDDVVPMMPIKAFHKILVESLKDPRVGFVGPAGATYLDYDAIWWYQRKHRRTRGFVWQDTYEEPQYNPFGGPFLEIPLWGDVLVLDGCFLAVKARTLDKINLSKPKEFSGNWDYYDIYYTLQSYEAGFVNKAVPLIILHNSRGELAGRDSWHKNRQALVKIFRLPMEIKT